MVQRKAPKKIGCQTETNRRHVKLERQSSSHQQQDIRNKGGGGGELKKKMRMVRSIKAADLESLQASPMKPKSPSPNYMKPTSSSDARKEQLQVTVHSQTTTDKKTSPKNSKNLNSSKPSSTSPVNGLKPSKGLSRQSSLKAIRSLMKKNLKGVVVNRATCSSTLKHSKFPIALDLDPGGTEAEGTSVMKVCPYTYCSLNGHRHEPLPPLKCFMSARRKLLKTQKSMKLKGLSSFRVKGLGKDKKEIDTEQKATNTALSGLEIAPPVEELSDDFFIKIYTSKPEEQTIDEKNIQIDNETKIPQVLSELAVIEDGEEYVQNDQMKETYTNTFVEDDVDQRSELSNEEIDVMVSFLEYVECDQQVEDAKEENTRSLEREDSGESCVECYLIDALGKDNKDMAESKDKVSTYDFDWEEEAGSPFPDNTTECSECADDGFGLTSPHDALSSEQITSLNACDVAEPDAVLPREVNQEAAEDGDASSSDELSIEPITVNACVVDEADAEFQQEVSHKFAESVDTAAYDGSSLEGSGVESHEADKLCRVDVLDQTYNQQEEESSEENNQEDITDSSFQDSEEVVSEEPEKRTVAGHALLNLDNDKSGILEPDGHEVPENLLKESIKGENENELEDTSSLSIVQLFDSCRDLTNSDQTLTEGDHIQTQPEIQVFKCDGATEDTSMHSDVQSSSLNGKSDDSDIGEEYWEESENEWQEEVSNAEDYIAESKARMSNTKKKGTEELDEMKQFNPRAPRFLPVEPDPDAEKVDLRHQMMDERKNSEEWMIDYALRRAVNTLAPARKRKVALLVEAFETVIPPPIYEKPLQHSTPGFIHARIMQACS